MEFEWDEQKAVENRSKHGVDFREAALAFFDENAVVLLDEVNSFDAVRYQLIGISPYRILFVAYTERPGTIRIISARTASSRHIKIYNDYNR
jgi:uncharacterized DUF497 family protein